MDIIQVGPQKLKCISQGDNVQVRWRQKKEFDLSWRMPILHIDICLHINLEYTEVMPHQNRNIINYLIHINSIY